MALLQLPIALNDKYPEQNWRDGCIDRLERVFKYCFFKSFFIQEFLHKNCL